MEIENLMERNNYIAVRSLTLLREIFDNKRLDKIAKIVPETDDQGKTYPVFLLKETERVTDCCKRFIEANGKDDRADDIPELWAGYDEEGIKNQRTCFRLNTRNYRVIQRAFESGQIGNLIHVFKDGSSNTTVFRFAHNEVLEAIKSEEDKKSAEAWKAKKEQEGKDHE